MTTTTRRPNRRTNRPRPANPPQTVRRGAPLRYVILLAAVVLLLGAGLVLVLSASAVTGLDQTGQTYFFFLRHLRYLALAAIALLIMMRVDYRRLRAAVVPLAVCTVAGLVTVMLQGESVNGSQRWLDAGPVNIQPSEFAKLALVLWLAYFLEQRRHQLARPVRIIRPVALVVGAVGFLVMQQPDLGTTIILGVIALGMLFAAGVPCRDITKLAATGAGVAMVLAWNGEAYRRDRIIGFLNPIETRQDEGYQVFQSLVGLANGGVRGVGLGSGQAKWGWLPNAHTDFIFAIIGEELGLVGALVVLGLFASIGVLGFRISDHAPDMFGSLLAAGITTWFMIQVLVNIGGVVGLLPITGVTLPFLSFGGSSLLANSVAMGILLNIGRQSR